MEKLKINGGRKLRGETRVQGAKNACLPILAAAALGESCIIHNCPDLTDTHAALKILESLGVCTEFENNTVRTHSCGSLSSCRIPDGLMKEMRSSVMFLGAILSKCKRAEITYPGGCSIGARPIDLHLEAFRKMGAEIEEEGDKIICTIDEIKSAKINLGFPSVGATENIMLLSAMSDAEIEIDNAAAEPEILDLQNFINSMGGNICSGGRKVFIKGVKELGNTEYKIMPDRIAALTYLSGIAACGGMGKLNSVRPEHMVLPLKILERGGSEIECGDDFIIMKAPSRPKSYGKIITLPYPGFPTDAQAIFMAAASRGRGKSSFKENIFENRFRHVSEIRKLGGRIETEGNEAEICGRRRLRGEVLTAKDLRGGAALVVAGLAAKGETIIENIGYIDRGYENIERSFGDFGAEIARVDESYGREIHS